MGKRVAILVELGEWEESGGTGQVRMWKAPHIGCGWAALTRKAGGVWEWNAAEPGHDVDVIGSGTAPTPEAARAAADEWLDSYIARVNEEVREELNARAAGVLPDEEASR